MSFFFFFFELDFKRGNKKTVNSGMPFFVGLLFF